MRVHEINREPPFRNVTFRVSRVEDSGRTD